MNCVKSNSMVTIFLVACILHLYYNYYYSVAPHNLTEVFYLLNGAFCYCFHRISTQVLASFLIIVCTLCIHGCEYVTWKLQQLYLQFSSSVLFLKVET